VSGIRQNEYPAGAAVVVRYPKKMTFEIQLDQQNEEMIYLPYLRINYRERTSTYIKNTDAGADIEFGTYYISSTEKFWTTAMAIWYSLLALLVLIVVSKMQMHLTKPVLSQD